MEVLNARDFIFCSTSCVYHCQIRCRSKILKLKVNVCQLAMALKMSYKQTPIHTDTILARKMQVLHWVASRWADAMHLKRCRVAISLKLKNTCWSQLLAQCIINHDNRLNLQKHSKVPHVSYETKSTTNWFNGNMWKISVSMSIRSFEPTSRKSLKSADHRPWSWHPQMHGEWWDLRNHRSS